MDVGCFEVYQYNTDRPKLWQLKGFHVQNQVRVIFNIFTLSKFVLTFIIAISYNNTIIKIKKSEQPSRHCPLKKTFCSSLNFSSFSADEKFSSLETALHFRIFLGTRAGNYQQKIVSYKTRHFSCQMWRKTCEILTELLSSQKKLMVDNNCHSFLYFYCDSFTK